MEMGCQYLLVLSSWKANITENPIAVDTFGHSSYLEWFLGKIWNKKKVITGGLGLYLIIRISNMNQS